LFIWQIPLLVSALIEAVAPGATEPVFSIWFEVVASLFFMEGAEAGIENTSALEGEG